MDRKAVVAKRKDGEIVFVDEVLTADQMQYYKRAIYEDEINALVATELDDAAHKDTVENYQTPLDFYLSNAIADGYIDYIQTCLRGRLDSDLAQAVQREVILKISRRVQAIGI